MCQARLGNLGHLGAQSFTLGVVFFLLDMDYLLHEMSVQRGDAQAAVGAVRDNDVLAERLRTQAGPFPEPDAASFQALMGLLAAQADTARAAMLSALRSDRYLTLLDALVQIAQQTTHPSRAPSTGRPGRRWRGDQLRPTAMAAS